MPHARRHGGQGRRRELVRGGGEVGGYIKAEVLPRREHHRRSSKLTGEKACFSERKKERKKKVPPNDNDEGPRGLGHAGDDAPPDGLALEHVPADGADVAEGEEFEGLADLLVIAEGRLGDVASFGVALGAGNGVAEEGQALAAVVAHGNAGGGHGDEAGVLAVVAGLGGEDFDEVSRKLGRDLGREPQENARHDGRADQKTEGLVEVH
mmetsp:Transcript_24431/g.75443  ORF Transcript_24431/g.75443 Transcript_24431/m.75443 type:complete len:209 (-) Transcript_24431:256-882(-)